MILLQTRDRKWSLISQGQISWNNFFWWAWVIFMKMYANYCNTILSIVVYVFCWVDLGRENCRVWSQKMVYIACGKFQWNEKLGGKKYHILSQKILNSTEQMNMVWKHMIKNKFNTLRPCDAIWWHRSGSTLFQASGNGLLPGSTKPLLEPMLRNH